MTFSAHRGEILHCLSDPIDTDGVGMDNETWQYFNDGILFIEDGHIVECDAAVKIAEKLSFSVEITTHSGLIIPGMIDTHIHYPQVDIVASYGKQLIDWLQTYTFPAESAFCDSYIANDSATFFIEELLLNGTTTALVFGTVHPQSVDSFFEVATKYNLRMICGKVMMDRNAPAELCDTPEGSYQDSENLIKKWHNKGRLGYAVTPRFAPTSSNNQLKMAGRLLKQYPDTHLHTHLSENKEECQWVKQLFPESQNYLDVYDRHGLLGNRSVFAHGIHLSDNELNRLSETQSKIAFCPTSNLFIGNGLFNLKKAYQLGVQVGLGTDIGGGDSFSLLRTINEAYKIQQLQQTSLSPIHSFYLSTLGGAKTLDLHNHIGNFEPGKEADFVVLDYQATPLIKRRIARTNNIQEKLFIMQMLGDDRAIKETWIMGERLYQKQPNL